MFIFLGNSSLCLQSIVYIHQDPLVSSNRNPTQTKASRKRKCRLKNHTSVRTAVSTILLLGSHTSLNPLLWFQIPIALRPQQLEGFSDYQKERFWAKTLIGQVWEHSLTVEGCDWPSFEADAHFSTNHWHQGGRVIGNSPFSSPFSSPFRPCGSEWGRAVPPKPGWVPRLQGS